MKSILYLGTNGFPNESASTEKQKLILKALSNAEDECLILAKKNYLTQDFKYKGSVDGIKYFYSTFTFKKKNKVVNKIIIVISQFVEKFKIISYRPDIAIISSRSYFEILSYFLLFRFGKTKTFLTHVEDVKSVGKKYFFNHINDYLFNRYAFNLVDGALPISDYLTKKIKANSPKCPMYKLPVMVNYDSYEKLIHTENLNHPSLKIRYILYCGSVAYHEVIDFIISVHQRSGIRFKLVLIINGLDHEVRKFRKEFENDSTIILSGISHIDLITWYKNSSALIIPLRESVQDKARFPHKIGEYCAAGNPIITNNWGEIPNYFKHMESAYICDRYAEEDYISALQFIASEPKKAKLLGSHSKEIARDVFDYKCFSETLQSFIYNI